MSGYCVALDLKRTDYLVTEMRIKLLHALEEAQAGWAAIKFEGTYADAMNQSVQFSAYEQTDQEELGYREMGSRYSVR